MLNFDEIWKKYESELNAFVLSKVKDKDIQKDIMQEVAIKIFSSLKFQNKHLRGWLYSLTKNTINDYYRKVNRVFPQIDIDEKDEEYILLECLFPMMERLTDEEQDTLHLTQIQQFSLKEVAKQKKLSDTAMKSRIFRAKKSLAKELFSCCDYERNSKGEIIDYIGKCK